MKTISVNLPIEAYEVKIGENILASSLQELLSDYSETSVFVVTNTTINHLYPDYIQNCLPKNIQAHLLALPDGEKYKNIETLNTIFDFLLDHGANRKGIIIAFGGGVIGDMAGFAAASFMRGMNFIQVPTTLLSQVDSGIGGKTGINHAKGKNSIGAFKQPLQTIIDVSFLKTLPKRELIAGYAELIKHGMIQDKPLFELLEENIEKLLSLDSAVLVESIYRSCSVKARVVEQDEKESSWRAILNFGHTLGHFLETYTRYTTYLHGEAVIGGLDFAAWWSMKYLGLAKETYQRIHEHLLSLGLTLEIPRVDEATFLELVAHDKKAFGSGVTFVGIQEIGAVKLNPGVSVASLWDDFQEFMEEKDSIVRQIH